MAPVHARFDPESPDIDLRDRSIALACGESLVKFGGNTADEAVRRPVEDCPIHEFIIDGKESKKRNFPG